MATFEKVSYDPFKSAAAPASGGTGSASAPTGGGALVPRRPTATKVEGNPFEAGRVAKRPDRTWGEVATDSLLGVASGTANIIGGLIEAKATSQPDNIARQGLRLLDRVGVPGTAEAAKYIPRRPSEAILGQPAGTASASVSAGVKAAGDWIGDKQSDALKQEKQELAETEGFIGSAKKVLTSPKLLGNFVAEQVPNIATLGGGTRLAAARAGQRALAGAVAKGMGEEAAGALATAAGRKAATTAATGITTAMETGSAGMQTYQQAMAQPQAIWDANPEYQRMVAAGTDPSTAKETIARGASMQAQAITAPIAAVAGRFAAPFEADVFTRSLVRRPMAMLQGAARETVEETIQEGGSQFAGNVGQQQVNPNQGAWEGVPEAAGTGAALGAVLGGGMAAGGAIASRADNQQPIVSRPQPPATAPPDLPPEQLALPPSDGQPNYGVNIVTPGGTVLTPEQRGLDPRVTGEPARPAPNPSAVPGPRVAADSLNQQPAIAPRPTVPFPDAAPGSLADAANATAAARGQQEPTVTSSLQDSVDPLATLAAAGTAEHGQRATTPPAPAPAIAPPWIDEETGEALRDPTQADIKQLLHANLDFQMANGGGISTKAAVAAMRDQYGLPGVSVRSALSQVAAERKRGATSQTPAPAADSTRGDIPRGMQADVFSDERLAQQVQRNTDEKRERIAVATNQRQPVPASGSQGESSRDEIAAVKNQDESAVGPDDAQTPTTPVPEPAQKVQGGIPIVSGDEASLQQSQVRGLPSVRGQRDPSVRSMDGKERVPSLPGGHGPKASDGDVARSNRSGGELSAEQLPLGDSTTAGEQSPLLPPGSGGRADHHNSGGSQGVRPTADDAAPAAVGSGPIDGSGDYAGSSSISEGLEVPDVRGTNDVRAGMGIGTRSKSANAARAASKGHAARKGIDSGVDPVASNPELDASSAPVTRAPPAASVPPTAPAVSASATAVPAAPAPAAAPAAAPATYTPRVRRIGGSPEYDRDDVGTLGAYFQPGRIVKGYAGLLDRVLEFRPSVEKHGRWSVKVQGVDKDGNFIKDEDPRWHSTSPPPRDLAEVLGKPELKPRKAAAAKPTAGAQKAKPKADLPRAADVAPNGIKVGDRVSVAPSGTGPKREAYEATVTEIEVNAAPVYGGTAFKVASDDAKPDGRGTGWVAAHRVSLVSPPAPKPAAAKKVARGEATTTEKGPPAAELRPQLFSLPAEAIDSQAFKRWFAGSKVVDATGKPLIVFHGTADEFYTFSKRRSGQATGHATAPLGHFFTPNRQLAERYAENASDGVPADERVVDAHLRIEKPYVMPLDEAQSLDSPEASAAFQAYLQRQGFDGIHIPEAETWIAFRPEQIKSASENRGTFELTNPDIRFSRGDTGPGLSFDRALQLKSELTAKWGDNAPNVVLVRSAEDFPSSAKVDPAYRRAEGLYNGSPTVWINAGAITNEARFGQVLAHEAIGHYGVEKVVGANEWAEIIDAIDKLASGGGGSAALRSVLDSVSQRYGTVDRETFAKEAIAVMAERGIRNSFTSRVVAAIRRFLRRLMPSLQWSESDVRDLLSQADGFLRAGQSATERQATVQAYAFSQGDTGSALQPNAEEAKTFREQFDKVVDSLRTVVPPITVGRTPPVLRTLGAPDLPITIMRDVVRKATNGVKHDVPKAVIRQLPELLADPQAVFDSRADAGGLAVLLDAKDASGRPVMVALHLQRQENRLVVNRIASAYGRPEEQYRGWTKDGLLRYVADAKNPDLVRLVGLQLPVSGSPSQGSSGRKVLSRADVVNEAPDPVRLGQLSVPGSGSPNQGSSTESLRQGEARVQPDDSAVPNPDKRLFSLPASDALDDIDAIQKGLQGEGLLARAKQLLADLTPKKLKDAQRPTWLGALATRHLTELGADYFDNINHYSDYLAEMQADRNQMQAEAEEIAEGARKWVGKNKAEAEQLFGLMHTATMEGVDPSKAYQPLMFKMPGQKGEFEVTRKNIKRAIEVKKQQMRERSGDTKANMINEIKELKAMGHAEPRRRTQYAPLVDRWNQLSPEAQEIYRQFRDAYRKRSDQVEQARVQRIEDMKGDGITQSHRRMLIQRIKQDFESERLQGVYFPLHRQGDFFVAAEKGDTYSYLMFESLNEAERKVAQLRERGWTIMAQGMKSTAKAKDAPSGSFVADVIQQLRESHVSEKVQDEVYQLYLETMPELSMRKRSIHRRSIPGFDTDAVRAFAFNMHHGAHQLARERFAYKLQDVLGLLEKQQDAARREPEADTRRIAAGDTILAELKSRHDWIMNPTDSALTNLVSSFGFTYYLGATPAAALVNLTQTALVSYPYLAARHGPVKAMNYMLAASRDAVRTMGNIQRTLTDPDELRAYQALQVSGAIDKTQAHNLAGIAEGGMAGYNPAWSKAMEIIGWGFHKTEVVNREATGMAAFRLARDGGAGFDEAVRSARDAIFDTHFDYSNANRARFMQSGTAKVLLMFRQYSLNMTWALGRMVWQSTKGQDPEVRRIARRNLAGVLGMSSLFSGALGLPMMSVAMGTLNALQAAFGDDDEPWDAETEFRAFLSEAVGPSGAELLLRGPANKLTGANIAGRVGLDSLWIRDADRELEGRGLFNHLLEQAAGPMGGVLKNVLVGTQQIGDGHTMRGVETMLPKGMKDVIKAGRYATQGVNTLRGDPVLEDVSLWQVLLQGTGFSPAKIAERYERNRALKNYEEHITGRRQSLMNAYAMAIRNGDAADRAAVMEKILAFNKTNPEVAISSSSIRTSMKSRARYSANAEGGIVLNPKLSARLNASVGPAE